MLEQNAFQVVGVVVVVAAVVVVAVAVVVAIVAVAVAAGLQYGGRLVLVCIFAITTTVLLLPPQH